MRFRHRDGTVVHLGYCANVHPADDLDGIVSTLADVAEPVRHRLDAERLGIGLWLPAKVAAGLAAEPAAVRRLRAELDARGLEVVTLNGFPYTGFGDETVKYRVYSPDWSDPARADYTADLATILSILIPADAAGASISTLPFGWRDPWPAARHDAARRQIDRLGARLGQIAERTGVSVHVGFEPEPGCVMETTAQAVEQLSDLDPDLFGLCLDAAHLAVAHEHPGVALARLAAAQIPVVKLQASAALEVPDPTDPAARAALEEFAEPRYLHQTREGCSSGLLGTDDLGEALSPDGALPGTAPWRVHYHLPLDTAPAAPLRGTHDVLVRTLTELFGGPAALTDHVEVETYTWQVLPPGRRPSDASGLARGIAAELEWTARRLVELGLEAS